MDTSDSYLVVERMIQHGQISVSELESLLHSLKEQQLITTVEHKSLLEPAAKINSDSPLPHDTAQSGQGQLSVVLKPHNKKSRCEPIHLRRSDLDFHK